MRTNQKASELTKDFTTHEGAPATRQGPEKELARTVAACMLYENTFYESGSEMAKRIEDLSTKVSTKFIAELAVRARGPLRIRHAALFLAVQMLKKKDDQPMGMRSPVAQAICDTIQRADELAEIVAMYWKDGKKPLPRQLKAGIAKAFRKFDAYQLAKYNRDDKVKLRDVLFLSHAKPKDDEQAAVFKKLVDKTLESPDTWEVNLSAGADKGETFTRLLKEKKLGYMALLRNLRNMQETGVDQGLIEESLLEGATKSKALPLRFVAAVKAVPQFANAISKAMLSALKEHEPLQGKTAIAIDCSGSMRATLSEKGTINRMEAAGALAVYLKAITPRARVWGFGTGFKELAAYDGLALVQAVTTADVGGWGTNVGLVVGQILREFSDVERIIVITDMQSHDVVPDIGNRKGYYFDTAGYAPAMPKQGGKFSIIGGLSERVVDWMREEEAQTE